MNSHREEISLNIYLADGSKYDLSTNDGGHEGNFKQRIAKATFDEFSDDSNVLIETIREPGAADLKFLVWQNGTATVADHIELDGRIFVPPDAAANFFPSVTFPQGLGPHAEPAKLLAEICATISQFAKLRQEDLLIVGSVVLASWFADCFEAIPYLWVVGPLSSGKTKLLRLLSVMCRRGLIAGDLRGASIYKLMDTWAPTLIIDEFELANTTASKDLLRLLRSGSVPGIPTFRNGRPFSTYGMKIIASRQPLDDEALLSRGVLISMLPSEADICTLDEATLRRISSEFQARLLTFRLTHHSAIKNFSGSPNIFPGLLPRTQQIARALAAPLWRDAETVSTLLRFLQGRDEEARVGRAMEPEWLVGEALFEICHQGIGTNSNWSLSEFLVGGVASRVSEKLKNHGENVRVGAKKVGLVMRALGLRTEKLGRLGRGLKLTSMVRRKIHGIARTLGIDRRAIATLSGLENGYGGVPCDLCEEFGVTGGLRYVPLYPERKPRIRQHRPGLLEQPDARADADGSAG